MKISNNKIDFFISQPDSSIRAILIYGPNEGLVSERKKLLTQSFVKDVNDPFLIRSLDFDEYGKSWFNLKDEVLSLSFTEGNRVLAFDKFPEKFVIELDELTSIIPNDLMLILTHGELRPSSKIRKFFENRKTTASIPCYADEVQDLNNILKSTFKSETSPLNNLQFEALSSRLNADRGINKKSIEKLYIYCNNDVRNLTPAEIQSVVQNEDNLSLEALSYAIADGDFAQLSIILGSIFQQGTFPIIILRSISYHFNRLFVVIEAMKNGDSFKSSISKLQPRVFFKLENLFQKQVSNWSLEKIKHVQTILLNAEIDCKLNYHLQKILCERTLLRIAGAAKS